jgi:signal transduction histidine kinase
METLLNIVGFSFGASLAIGAMRSLSHGLRPALVDGLKMTFAVRDALGGLTAEARQGLRDVRDDAAAERQARSERARPRRIAIARD